MIVMADQVQRAVNVLGDHGYLRRLPDDKPTTAGRPAGPRYAVNPLEPTGEASR